MYQGQIGWLESRNNLGASGWYMKLRDDGHSVRFYPLSGLGDPIPEGQVDATDYGSQNDRPYRLTCEVPTELQVQYIRFDPTEDLVERIRFHRQTAEIRRRIDALRHVRITVNGACVTFDEATEMLRRDQQLLQQLETGDPVDAPAEPYMYVHAHHPGNPTDYCWYVPPNLENRVCVGSVVTVDTARGRCDVTVERVRRSALLERRERVVAVTEPDVHLDNNL